MLVMEKYFVERYELQKECIFVSQIHRDRSILMKTTIKLNFYNEKYNEIELLQIKFTRIELLHRKPVYVYQTARPAMVFDIMSVGGKVYGAQERDWGFVVPHSAQPGKLTDE